MDTQAIQDLNLTSDPPMVYTGGMDAIAKPRIPTPDKGTCGCGCGESVKKRFKPGHDARLKSILLDVARNGSTQQAERAAWQMVESGWSRFVDDAILIALPQRNRRGQRKIHIDQVDRWLMEPTVAPGGCHGTCHANAACPALTAAARAAGRINKTTRLAASDWVVRPNATEANREHLRQSWDLCTECVATETVLEQCEDLWFRTALGIAALDQEAGNVEVLTPAQRTFRMLGVTIEADLDEDGLPYPTRCIAA